MAKSALSLLFISASLFASEVKFCGANRLEHPKDLEEVCYISGSEHERAIVLKYKSGARITYPVVIQSSEYASETAVTIEDGTHKKSTVTVYRHYEPGIYPGDGENRPIALEGKTPDGIALKVVELEYQKN